jgi:hypothetical protein
MILSKKLVLLATTLVFLTSCKEDSESRATLDIAGKWEYVVSYSNGYEQQMLNVQKDSSIIISWSLYGVQPNTTPDQLNATIDYYGELDIVQPQVEFNVYEYIYNDYYLEIGPDTLENNTVFFKDCLYEINGDTLILNYTTSPADIPVRGERKFVKIE